MRISKLTLGLVDTNTYFVENDHSVILFDPAGEVDKIFKKLNQINKPLQAVLLTHAHFDHIGALDEVLAKKQVTKLSGGQQQRVAIVRAICCEHQLIVADEPTGNLDETASQDIVKLFQEIAHEQNRCIIIVTHEVEVAKSCDEVFELKNKEFQKIEV
ncbi:MAG: MBL fold metallo-hydrolase [Staphylococcus lugdunensis]|nr:MBL fold metallo-hydrolase [Staphylococcus lugdunensis]